LATRICIAGHGVVDVALAEAVPGVAGKVSAGAFGFGRLLGELILVGEEAGLSRGRCTLATVGFTMTAASLVLGRNVGIGF